MDASSLRPSSAASRGVNEVACIAAKAAPADEPKAKKNEEKSDAKKDDAPAEPAKASPRESA